MQEAWFKNDSYCYIPRFQSFAKMIHLQKRKPTTNTINLKFYHYAI